MFGQWLLVLCSLLFLSGPAMPAGVKTCAAEEDMREVTRFVSGDVQYGWQVSSGVVSAYEVPAN